MKAGYNTPNIKTRFMMGPNIKTRFMMGLTMFLHKDGTSLSEPEYSLYKFILSRKKKLQGYRIKYKTYWSIWG